jgi:hypothetical protein
MLFPDDMDDSPLLPARPREIAQPIARRSSAVAPSNRRMDWSPGVPPRGVRSEHVAIPVRPIVPSIFVPRSRVGPPIPAFYDPTGRKLRTNKSAFRINPDSVVKSPLRKGEIPARAQGPYMPGGRHRTKKAGRRIRSTRRKAHVFRSRKASRPSTRATLRR